MKKNIFYIFVMFLFLTKQASAQSVNDKILGKWLTKDEVVMEVSANGNALYVKQVSAKNEKNKKDNGKIVGKNITNSSGKEFKGIIIDPDNNKEYSSIFTISADGKKLLLSIKWGFMSFSENWYKVQ